MKRVVIVGGGYGGLKAAHWLANKKHIHVTLIDKHKYHYLQTDAYDFIANKSDISDITLSLESFLLGLGENLDFVNDEVLCFNAEQSLVFAKNVTIAYDYLIIATGALTNFPSKIIGIKEFSNGVKSLFRALEFKQKFENTIFEFLKSSFLDEQKKFNIIIGGAGLSGIEIAAEMAFIVEQYCKAIGIKNNDAVTITLVEGSATVLPGIHTNIVNIAQNRLDELGVIVKTNSFIAEVTQENVILANGDIINYDFMIFTGGIKARPIESDLSVNLNYSNQYVVDEYFRISSKENIFAIGDVAEIKVRGNIVPSTAQSAEQAGIFCAKNILQHIAGQKLKKYEPKIYGMFVALGGKFGVGVLLNRAIIKGYKAYLLKKFISFFYKIVIKSKVFKGYKKLDAIKS